MCALGCDERDKRQKPNTLAGREDLESQQARRTLYYVVRKGMKFQKRSTMKTGQDGLLACTTNIGGKRLRVSDDAPNMGVSHNTICEHMRTEKGKSFSNHIEYEEPRGGGV